MDEFHQLPALLMALKSQSYQSYDLYVCVNQPDGWWNDEDKLSICHDNNLSIELLNQWKGFRIKIIDRSSRGKGWIGKRHGVGWARKTVMDKITEQAEDQDIIVSLDADTLFGKDYLRSIADNLSHHSEALALAVPYYHQLTGDAEADRAILRYEVYMRSYNINMLTINSPYAFTALGSAMAFPVWAYKKVGGITPVLSGEDFYFLQKMVKTGPVLRWNTEKVYPAARFSDRVYFGTGPAMEKGRRGDWGSYPVYHYSLFKQIENTYQLFPELYKKNVITPMDRFLNNTFKEDSIWDSLRDNYRSKSQFMKGCHTRLDGLRLLQFLKMEQKKLRLTDEQCLMDNLNYFNSEILDMSDFNLIDLSFTLSDIGQINLIREELVKIEERLQTKYTL
jgi:hypothetical protein